MKAIRSLFMIAIGMMVFTATATTAKLEQKQKSELVKQVTAPTNAVVVNEFQAVSIKTDVAKSNDINVVQLETVTYPVNYLAIVTDVGWRSLRQLNKNIPYTEKLLENCNLHYKQRCSPHNYK